MQNRIYRKTKPDDYTPQQLVAEFLQINNEWFENPENSMYGRHNYALGFLEAWAKDGFFSDTYNDSMLIYIEGKFTEWLESVFHEVPANATTWADAEDITTLYVNKIYFRLKLHEADSLIAVNAQAIIREHLQYFLDAMWAIRRAHFDNGADRITPKGARFTIEVELLEDRNLAETTLLEALYKGKKFDVDGLFQPLAISGLSVTEIRKQIKSELERVFKQVNQML